MADTSSPVRPSLRFCIRSPRRRPVAAYFKDAMSMTKRYFTSLLTSRS
jgi:hypothetical protein